MESPLQLHDRSILYDEHGTVIPHHVIERDEQCDAYSYIPKESTVLELGARYGMVSCLISKILKNPKNHVAVEPDSDVIPALIKNRDNTGSQFSIFNGVVSRKPQNFNPLGLGSFTSQAQDQGNVATTTMQDLEDRYQLKFDVLVADCEGFIGEFIEENDINQFKLILLEKDRPEVCDYNKVEDYLTDKGFIRITNKPDPLFPEVCRSVYANMNFLPFKILSYEVAHGNIGLFGKMGYDTDVNGRATTDLELNEPDVSTISAHAFSKIIISTDKNLSIRGYCSPSSKYSPLMTFKCNGEVVGTISDVGAKTLPYKIGPGTYELIVETNNIFSAHSVWLFQSIENKDNVQLSKKFLKIDLLHSGPGLFNQFINVINGLMIGHCSKRQIYNPRFLPDYRSTNWIPLSSVIDIPHLNGMLRSLELNTQIEVDEKLSKIEWKVSPNRGFLFQTISNSLVQVSSFVEQESHDFLDIGWVFSLVMEKDQSIRDIELHIYKNIQFLPEYKTVFNYCLNNYLNTPYNVVHLRLEDDWINHQIATSSSKLSFEEHSQIIWEKYCEAMARMFTPQDKIFIATYLNKTVQRNNHYIDQIRLLYPNAITATPWRENFNLPTGREIDAIIDFMICRNGEKFIGLGGSTFSVLTAQIIHSNGKETILV